MEVPHLDHATQGGVNNQLLKFDLPYHFVLQTKTILFNFVQFRMSELRGGIDCMADALTIELLTRPAERRQETSIYDS